MNERKREFLVEGFAPPIGHHCDAVRFGDVLHISGIPPTDATRRVVVATTSPSMRARCSAT